jgi:hypothetical protein
MEVSGQLHVWSLYPWGKNSNTYWTSRDVGPRAGLGAMDNNLCLCQQSNSDSLGCRAGQSGGSGCIVLFMVGKKICISHNITNILCSSEHVICIWFKAVSEFIQPIYGNETGPGTHPASYTRVPGAVSSGIKRQGPEADHWPPPSAEFKNGGAILSLPHKSSWRGAKLIKHRDPFTLIEGSEEVIFFHNEQYRQFFTNSSLQLRMVELIHPLSHTSSRRGA